MTAEERLARIEEKLITVADGLATLNANLDKLIVPRISDLESRLTRLEASTSADLKILRLAVGMALLSSVGSGAGLLSKLLGVL